MKKTLSVIISLVMVFSIIAAVPFTVTATELTGDGSKDNPYLISDYAGLKAFAEKVNIDSETGANAKLTGNIVADDEAWTPIGNNSKKYTGTFDGDGHKITGLTTPSDYFNSAGLFGFVDKGGIIRNVGLEGGSINGSYDVGGIVGRSFGTVQNCYNTGTVNGVDYVGGIVGSNYAPDGKANVTNCYNTGAVTGTDNYAYVGGIVGSNYAPSGGTVEVTNCYNTGAVTGTGNYACVGGIVGENYAPSGGTANVTNCYNTGAVTGTGSNADVGGIVGYNCAPSGGIAKVTNCCFDDAISNTANAIGRNKIDATATNVKGLTTAKMTGTGALTNMGFSDTSVWLVKENTDFYTFYPHLKGFEYDNSGSNSDWASRKLKANAMEISDYAELKAFADKVNNHNQTDLNGILTKDIVADDKAWTPIGSSSKPYTGVFDGQGYVIRGLSTPDDCSMDYVGLFGYVGSGGIVQNVGLEDGKINGKISVGGVVGITESGTVTNCYNTGCVSATEEGAVIGGVIGRTLACTVTNCYNTGFVSATGDDSTAGGVIGANSYGTVTNCYNTASVSATGYGSNAGGVIGYVYSGTIESCYNTGSVSDASYTGGVTGASEQGIIKNCFNTGVIIGTSETGGIVGENQKTVTDCYNIGSVSGGWAVGGVSGRNFAKGVTENSFYDKSVCGDIGAVQGADDDTNKAIGLSTAEMTGGNALDNMAFTDTSIWLTKANADGCLFYPHLKGFAYDTEPTIANWPAKIELSVIWSGSGSYKYNAAEQKPVVSSVTIGGNELTSGADYTVNYKVKNGGSWSDCTECINAGEYRAIITFGGVYPDIVKNFTINKASLKITAKNKEYTYNGSNQGPGDTVYENAQEIANVITADGLKGTDKITSVEVDGQGKDAGDNYVLTPQSAQINGTNAQDSNYVVTYVNGVLKINLAKITIAADNKETNHGDDLDELTYKITGDYYGEDFGISLSTDADNKTPGTYDITVSYTPNSNYNVTVQNGKYVVGDNPHTWGEITYEWNGTHSVTASRTCNYCGEVETETVDTTAEQTKDPTCTDKGENTYTATFTNPAFETQTKTVEDVEAAGHKLTHYPYTAPSSTEDGNIEYWYCEQCHKYFSDENGENEITETVIPLVPEYTFDSDNLEWTKDSGEDLEFTVNRSADDDKTFGLFLGIEIDGSAVSEENYIATKGSVNIKLSADYLSTLSAGEHTMKLLFTDGETETTFTVNDKEEPAEPDKGKTDEPATEPEKTDSKPAEYEPIPKTGNAFNPWICIAVLAGPCLAAIYGRKKKEDEKE